MKILGLVCSPRKGGNTEIMMNEALEGARSAGAETEMIFVADKNIAPCDGCETCHKTGRCRTKDDMQAIYEKMEAADGIIFGTPVYFTNVSAQAKIVIDRTYAFLVSGKLKGKVAGALIAVRRVGASQVLSLLYTYFAGQRMISAGGALGYGRDKGDVREGVGGAPNSTALQEAGALGRNMVRMVSWLAAGKTASGVKPGGSTYAR